MAGLDVKKSIEDYWWVALLESQDLEILAAEIAKQPQRTKQRTEEENAPDRR
jgi:hypothetical protein